jgi:hypothetical protein
MRLRGLLVGLALLAAPAAAADLYRCVEADGSVRFSDDPSRCPGASPHTLRGEIQRPAASSPSAIAPDAGHLAPWRGARAELLALFEPAGAEWEIVEEAPSDPAQDPDLRGGGVRALLARHYTRDRGGGSEVCSVEIWAFEDAKRLASARAHLERPGWRYHQEGSLLVMLRGVRFQRERGFQKGLFPDCERLGERIRARVAARTR